MHDRQFAEAVGASLVASIRHEQDEIQALLNERGETCNKHGTFADAARTTERIKRAMTQRFRRSDSMNYALDQIAGKMGRINVGDPLYADHWRDIAGYATLVANELATLTD